MERADRCSLRVTDGDRSVKRWEQLRVTSGSVAFPTLRMSLWVGGARPGSARTCACSILYAPVFERLFGKHREAAVLARRAEVDGDLARAAQLWMDAGQAHEAARVMVMRGDVELDSGKRLQHYVQAIALAPSKHPVRAEARRKRALLAIEMARSGATSAAARRDLIDAASELEALGEAAQAAEAYAIAGDIAGEARSLVEAGDVEKLEDVLTRDNERERGERASRDSFAEIDRLVASGERREAIARARATANDEKERAILARRATAPRVTIELHGARVVLVLGDEVIVGRSLEPSECAITVASHAVSRSHVVIARAGDRVEVRDLGSRNGTELRGMRIGGAMPVPSEGLDVKLGGEVPLRIAASDVLAGAMTIRVAGETYVAPLGPARLDVGTWRIEASSDGWIELVTDEAPRAYLGMTELGPRTALLAGDAIGEERGGPVVVRVVG